MRITASDVSRVVSGTLVGQDADAYGCAFDSRILEPNQAFVAIVGERDGHDYLVDARERGARFALVERGRSIDQLTCIEVEDTMVALAAVGQMCRSQLSDAAAMRVVGITGSAGKTSTKNAIRAVLDVGFAHVYASAQSLNNDIGVPITVMNAPDSCGALIVEMGMRGFGEIERLCDIARPTIGVITNVGDAHSERVGGLDGVARAKGELIESLPENGTAILNADDARVVAMSSRTWAKVMTYGSALGADVRWTAMETLDDGRIRTRFDFDGESVEATPRLPGVHMAANAAAAIAVGLTTGMTLGQCVLGVGREATEDGRVIWRDAQGGARILDDTYNANSSSMIAALHVLARSDARRRFAVLGQMFEVSDPQQTHRHIVQVAQDAGIEVISFETDLYGIEPTSLGDLVGRLALQENDVVLVKGSRAARMERIVALLTGTQVD
jgi:UDP-N-acetylmuramoyl-tripeptide--D-alanyl-D-alanine ligase